MNKLLLTGFLSLILCYPAFAQNDGLVNQQSYHIRIQRAVDEIQVDGLLEESAWKVAEVARDFWQKSPRDDIKAVLKTEMLVTYDDQFLYVAGTCYGGGEQVVSTLKRDIGFWQGDGVAVMLDPLNEASSGFMFGTNPYGVQTEVLLGGGSGEENYNQAWDNRWFSEARIYDDHWTFEMAIPFKTLRYEAGRSTWGINFMRNDQKNNRLDTWAPIPLQFWMIDLGYTGRLEWDKAPKKNDGNIALIPYVTASSAKQVEANEPAENLIDAGVDAKIALSPSLNLDLTVNPDFSQVEVDQQVTNLTRFSIFLPERRTFFLENSDIFTQVGFPLVQPFFSRRIGLDPSGRAVPILFGARLTGNLTGTTRIGLLNTQTRATENQLAQNYTAAAFSQRVFKRSRIQGLFLNRQAFDQGEIQQQDYGRNASLKFNYVNPKGTFQFWTGGHLSLKPGISEDHFYTESGLGYEGKRFSILFDHAYLGNNYFADMGFVNLVENYDAVRDTVIRLGFHIFYMPITLRFIPTQSQVLNQHSVELENFLNLDPQLGFVERSHSLSYKFEFKNSSELGVQVDNKETDLRFPFTFTGGEPIPVGRYVYNQFALGFESDNRKLLQAEAKLSTGGFYNGNLTSINLGLLYRRQPWGNFGLAVEYNALRFPEPYGSTTLWAFSPRIEISFNRNLFWTTFLQYNTQLDNFNINSRLQWRFAPMSDLYLVYTDNYAIENFFQKNRAIVLKLNYWLVM